MALNDRLKGSYYLDYTNKLSSKAEVNNQIVKLESFYTELIGLINSTYDTIDEDRVKMIEYLNKINLKLQHIKYMLNNFDTQIDDQLTEKLHNLMEEFSTQFTDIIDKYSLNIYNHKALSDTNETGSETDPVQGYDEYNRSINQLQTSMNIQWFGGKLNDKNVLNKLNNVLRIVKHNTTEGKLNEDYINSNLILELFLFSPKGMTWLELGQNSTFGYNMIIKYQSNSTGISALVSSEKFNTPKSYDINDVDLDMILNLGLDSESATGSNIYIKVKTNIPSFEYSGKDEYYLNSSDNNNEFENSKKIGNINENSVLNDNPDVEYVFKHGNTLSDQYSNTKNFIKITSEFITNLQHQNDIDIDEYNKNNSYNLYSKISVVNGVSKPLVNLTQLKGTSLGTLTGGFNILNGIVINPETSTEYSDDNKVLDGLVIENSKYTDDYTPGYTDKKQIIDKTDYRNIGSTSLMAKNENMFAIDNGIDKSVNVINNNEKYGDFENDKKITNKTYNNGILDILSDDDFSQNVHAQLGSFDATEIYDIKETNTAVFITTNNGVYSYDTDITKVIITSLSSGKYGKIIELNSGYIAIMSLDNNGIYYYTGLSNGLHTFTKTNIISGTFTDAIENLDKTSFYAVANTGSIDYDSTNQVYKINNILYKYKNGIIYEFGDILADEYSGSSKVKEIDSTIKDIFFSGTGNDLKLYYASKTQKYYIFNKTTKHLFESNKNEFGFFTSAKITENTDDNITDVNIDKNGNIYYSTSSLMKFKKGKLQITSGYYRNYVQYFKDKDIFITGNSTNTGLYYSTDGITWTQSNITSGYYWNCIQYFKDKDIFIAGNESDTGLYYSTDGKTWTQTNITTGTYNNYVQYFKDKDIFITGNDYSNTGLYYSTDESSIFLSNSDSSSVQLSTLMSSVKNGKNYYKTNFQLTTIDALSSYSPSSSIYLTGGRLKLLNNQLFVVPSSPKSDEIQDIVYENNFYYILVKSGKVYKLSDSLKVLGSINISPSLIFNFKNILAMLSNSILFTDNETIKNLPKLYVNDSVTMNNITYETKVISKVSDL